MHLISGGAIHELMAAGEMPMSISIFRNHVLLGQAKGAPTDWVPMDLNPTNAGGVALPRASKHPHAALLSSGFPAGPEGTENHGRKISLRDADQRLRFQTLVPGEGMTLDQYEKAEGHWKKLLRDMSRSETGNCATNRMEINSVIRINSEGGYDPWQDYQTLVSE